MRRYNRSKRSFRPVLKLPHGALEAPLSLFRELPEDVADIAHDPGGTDHGAPRLDPRDRELRRRERGFPSRCHGVHDEMYTRATQATTNAPGASPRPRPPSGHGARGLERGEAPDERARRLAPHLDEPAVHAVQVVRRAQRHHVRLTVTAAPRPVHDMVRVHGGPAAPGHPAEPALAGPNDPLHLNRDAPRTGGGARRLCGGG